MSLPFVVDTPANLLPVLEQTSSASLHRLRKNRLSPGPANTARSVNSSAPQSASAYAIAALQDRIRYNTLPENVGREQMVNQASLLAATMAVSPERFADMRTVLLPFQNAELPELIFQAILLGWNEKWKD